MIKPLMACGTISLVLFATSCNQYMFDNNSYNGEAAYTLSRQTLDTCGEVKVSPLAGQRFGTNAIVPTPNKPYAYASPYHIGLKEGGYTRSEIGTDEYTFMEPPLDDTVATLLLKRPGTYVYATNLGRKYSEAMTFTCTKTGQTANVEFQGVVLELRDAREVRIVSTIVHQIGFDAAGRFVVTWKEFPAASTPAEKGYL